MTTSYSLRDVDLLSTSTLPDLVPTDPEVRDPWLRSLARDAAVHGLPAVLQYEHLHALAVDATDPDHVGFNALRHDAAPAGPEYVRFRTPNADTLYSHGWVDLTSGPVQLDVPAMGPRYYTAHFLDMWSNAVNLSTRTLGPEGGRVWLTTTDWAGEAPESVRVVRMSTPYQWLLLRVFVRDPDDLEEARALQQAVRLTPTGRPADGDGRAPWPRVSGPAEDWDALEFFTVLDDCLRRNGCPVEESALVARFRALGIGADQPFDAARAPEHLREALRVGHAEALAVVRSVLTLRGVAAGGNGWRTLHSGSYGVNHLHRAATNYQGLGATVREESGPYTTFVDSAGDALDGSRDYVLRLDPPPPVDAFWSLSAYDRETRHFVPNPADRYSVNDHSRGLVTADDGSVEIRLTSRTTGAEGPNTLPVPPGGFYLVLRAYLGRAPVLDGSWTPPPVHAVAPAGDPSTPTG
jgi:hypothetical protein